ncbi:hypothetical protein Taro_031156 [Colocasia esculenta]|uniref:C2 NT-type domain-containing protein n=1 Tax=Colocasia esculenta TaxID=4460 RepID=A0A843VN69_COLES|nr:hypothetical protein [Colocasia esculenta]
MFKAARWRSEKNKIKVVFKLQFQATQIPQGKWDTLMVSLIPVDVGKATARSEKASVCNGSCRWEKPIYETVRFVREPKTGTINEKIYQIRVSGTGSPKAAILGEATIDLVDYAEAIKPSSVSLPLEASDSNALLHVTIHRMQDEANGREAEEDVEKTVRSQTRMLNSQFNNFDKAEDQKVPSGINSIIATEKPSINGEVRMKFPSSRAMVLHAESNANLQKLSSFDAISASGSDISSGQYTSREIILRNGNLHQDSTSLLSPLSNNYTPRSAILNASDSPANYGDHQRSNTRWSGSLAPDGSMDGSTNSSDEAIRERIQGSDDSIDKLKNDLILLGRQVEVSELELQALRKQVVKERRQVDDLSKDLCSVKEERDALRKECKQVKTRHEKDGEDGGDLRSIIKEITQELDHEKNLNANLRLQLQKTQESNAELILAVRDLDEMLEQKNREISCGKCDHMVDKQANNDNYKGERQGNVSTHLQNSERPCEGRSIEEEDEQYALEVLVKERDMNMTFSLEQKITELNNEIEVHRKDREELEMQMEQLALDYEILKQENHDISLRLEQTQLREQLRMQYECSAHLSIINELETHVENLERELENQAEAFEADLTSLTCAKVEQEKRAIQLEEALRKARWKNVNTAGHLKNELERLSTQMTSMFSKNKNLATEALAEADELRLQNRQLGEMLEKANLELLSMQNQFKTQLDGFATEKDWSKSQMEQLNMKLKDKSEELENQKKSEAEKNNTFSEEMLKLSSRIEWLEREKIDIYQQLKQKDDSKVCGEQLKVAIRETEMLLQTRSAERDALQRECCLMKEAAKKLHEELSELRQLKEGKESTIRKLNSELQTLRAKHNGLDSLTTDEMKEESPEKQVSHPRDYFQKEDYANTRNRSNGFGITCGSERVNLENEVKLVQGEIKLKNTLPGDTKDPLSDVFLSNGNEEPENSQGAAECNHPPVCKSFVQKESRDVKRRIDGFQTNEDKNHEIQLEPNSRKKRCTCALNGVEQELSNSKIEYSSQVEEVSVACPNDQGNLAEMLSEMVKLRDMNKTMEEELKEMQERYSAISLKFAEVEGERQQLVMTVRSLKNALKN